MSVLGDLASPISAIGDLASAGIGAATQGQPSVKPVQLYYNQDVQNMLLPLAMQGISGWGSNVPQQYLANSGTFGKAFSGIMNSPGTQQANAQAVASGQLNNQGLGEQGYGQLMTGAGGHTAGNPLQYFNSAYGPSWSSQAAPDAGYVPLQNGQTPHDQASLLNGSIQQSSYAYRPQFGNGGGNLGGYNSGYPSRFR